MTDRPDGIACIPTWLAKQCDGYTEATPDVLRQLRDHVEFVPEERAEICQDLVELSTYTLVYQTDPLRLFVYRRAGGEERLDGELSFGVGGHVERRDFRFSNPSPFLEVTEREMAEELNFVAKSTRQRGGWYGPQIHALLYTDEDDVSRDHLAIVSTCEVKSAEVREEGKLLEPSDGGHWHRVDAQSGKAVLVADTKITTYPPKQAFETWSRALWPHLPHLLDAEPEGSHTHKSEDFGPPEEPPAPTPGRNAAKVAHLDERLSQLETDTPTNAVHGLRAQIDRLDERLDHLDRRTSPDPLERIGAAADDLRALFEEMDGDDVRPLKDCEDGWLVCPRYGTPTIVGEDTADWLASTTVKVLTKRPPMNDPEPTLDLQELDRLLSVAHFNLEGTAHNAAHRAVKSASDLVAQAQPDDLVELGECEAGWVVRPEEGPPVQIQSDPGWREDTVTVTYQRGTAYHSKRMQWPASTPVRVISRGGE